MHKSSTSRIARPSTASGTNSRRATPGAPLPASPGDKKKRTPREHGSLTAATTSSSGKTPSTARVSGSKSSQPTTPGRLSLGARTELKAGSPRPVTATEAEKKTAGTRKKSEKSDTGKKEEVLRAELDAVRQQAQDAEQGRQAALEAETKAKELLRAKDEEIARLQVQLQAIEEERGALSIQKQGEYQAAMEQMQTELASALARNKLYDRKFLEMGVDTVSLEANPALPNSDNNHRGESADIHAFEEKLESLRSSLRDKKDMLHTRLNNARALTDKLKCTLEQTSHVVPPM